MTIPYPKQGSFYKVFIVDNYHHTLKELNAVFPNREDASVYGYKYLNDLSNLSEDERVHKNDIHVYLQTVSLDFSSLDLPDERCMVATAFVGPKWKVMK